MPRARRIDSPGTWHHVMNRAVGHRPLFESHREIKFFLDRIGQEIARRGAIEVHAYCVLTTHYHLLVRSVDGTLAAAMRRIQDGFARWFNATRDRDGPLFRGRFCSRVVDATVYWQTVVRYIDRNAVEAGLTTDPAAYPYSSARYFLSRPRHPWLEHRLIAAFVRAGRPTGSFVEAYRRTFDLDTDREPMPLAPELRTPLRAFGRGLDDLVRASPSEVQSWMRERARVADGVRIGSRLVDPSSVLRYLSKAHSKSNRLLGPTAATHDESDQQALAAGLLHELAGADFASIASLLGGSESSVQRAAHRFRRRLIDPKFAELASCAVGDLLRATYGALAVRDGWSIEALGSRSVAGGADQA